MGDRVYQRPDHWKNIKISHMKIGLIDVDGHHYPNLPLMKLSAWHKQQGDHVEWYQPLFSGHLDIVYMSKVFTFTPDYEYFVDADKVIKGGTGYFYPDGGKPLPDEIERIYPDYSLYPNETKDTAYGFLTRGCPRGCKFCIVGHKEGRCSKKVADLSEFWRGQKNIILCDPNILACPDHMELLQQLADSGAKVNFNQGLDARLVNENNIELLSKIRLDKIHFAYDRCEDKEIIEPKMEWIKDKTGWSRSKGRVTVYILVNHGTTIGQDIERIQFCRSLDWTPYPMIFEKDRADPIYKKLQRWCNNRIFWITPTFEDYKS